MKLLLVDDDPIFRVGFCTALRQERDWEIAAESFATVLGETSRRNIDVILCDPAWQGDRLWLRYRELQGLYPELPIVLLTSQLEPERILQAKWDGLAGYLPKGLAIAELVPALATVAAGGKVWSQRPQSVNQNMLSGMRRRNLKEIYAALDRVESYLNSEELSQLYRLIFAGQRRELKTAAWLVRRLLPQAYFTLDMQTASPTPEPEPNGKLIPTPPVAIATTNSLWQKLLDETFIKLNGNLNNATNTALALDILTPEKRRELFYIILQQLNLIFNDPQWQQLDGEEFQARHQRGLRNLWKFTAQEFIARCNLEPDLQAEQFLLTLNQAAIANGVDNIPYSLELFTYLLQEQPLIIDNVQYRIEAKESLQRAQLLLENLLITIGDRILQFTLNTFNEAVLCNDHLYNPKIRSSRDIARFRNDLSWQYRRQKYWLEPKAIFESQYPLLTFQAKGINHQTIYAPRHAELNQLRGIAWAVTMILEFRDALAPRLRAFVAWLGTITVYVLTKIVGRALGLIARGISEGVGTSWQSVKGKN